MMKKQLALVLAAVFCLSAAACDSTAASSSQAASGTASGSYTIPDPDFAAEPVTLKQFESPTGPTATIKTTMGDIEVMFFPEEAPKAVENFLTHAKSGYYDGLIFHRVINDFMIQGGDPEGNGTGGESIWGSKFEDEFSDSLRNFRGALAMANSGKNTNGSQFFIVQTTKAAGMQGYADNCYAQFLERNAYKRIYAQTPGMTEQQQQDYLAAEQQKLNEQLQQPTPQAYLDRMAPVIAKYDEIGGTAYLDGVHTVFGQVTSGMEVVDAIAAVATQNDRPVEDVKIISIEVKE